MQTQFCSSFRENCLSLLHNVTRFAVTSQWMLDIAVAWIASIDQIVMNAGALGCSALWESVMSQQWPWAPTRYKFLQNKWFQRSYSDSKSANYRGMPGDSCHKSCSHFCDASYKHQGWRGKGGCWFNKLGPHEVAAMLFCLEYLPNVKRLAYSSSIYLKHKTVFIIIRLSR